MSKPERDVVREQHWREAVAAWRASGLSVRAKLEDQPGLSLANA